MLQSGSTLRVVRRVTSFALCGAGAVPSTGTSTRGKGGEKKKSWKEGGGKVVEREEKLVVSPVAPSGN